MVLLGTGLKQRRTVSAAKSSGVFLKVEAPHQRLDISPRVDAYGFRSQDPRVLFLCPFEFFMCWEIQRVPEPYRGDCKGRSTWSQEGLKYYGKDKHAHNFKLIPGEHYKATAQYVQRRMHADAHALEHLGASEQGIFFSAPLCFARTRARVCVGVRA